MFCLCQEKAKQTEKAEAKAATAKPAKAHRWRMLKSFDQPINYKYTHLYVLSISYNSIMYKLFIKSEDTLACGLCPKASVVKWLVALHCIQHNVAPLSLATSVGQIIQQCTAFINRLTTFLVTSCNNRYSMIEAYRNYDTV